MYATLAIPILAVFVAAIFGRRIARWGFDQLMTRVMARASGFRDWAIQADQWHREQLRAASAAVDRLEIRIDRLDCQVMVQLADLSETQRSSVVIQERVQAETQMLRASLTTESTRLERSISEQISQVEQRTASAFDEVSEMQRQIHEYLSGQKARLDQIDHQIAQAGQITHSAIGTLSSNLAEISATSGRLFAELAAVTFRTTQVEALLRTTFAKQSPLIAESLLSASDDELVRLAESLAILRPLVPYPEWRFDADWDNPDLSFQIRQRLWQHFTDRDCKATVVLPWHLGTRLCMHLNNDLSRQIFIAGYIDPNEFTFLDRFLAPGMTFVDVGANEGIYSIFAARRVGESGLVWAFEPSQRELERLRRNMAYNALEFRVYDAGLSDSERQADLKVAESLHAGLNTMGKIPYEGVNLARVEKIQLFRLDDLVFRSGLSRVDLIKIDIEGGEMAMLRGAGETLLRYRPILLFELLRPALASQGASPEEVIEFLQGQRYVLYYFGSSTGFPTLAKPTESNGWSAFGAGENLIGVPEEVSLPAAVFSYQPADLTALRAPTT